MNRLIQAEDRKKILYGMILTRATDNALKHWFMIEKFQGKGFRSLGQEAIYAAGYVLRKRVPNSVIAPMIRDLGAILAFTNHDVALVINAQAGKIGAPMNGRDLHVGDLSRGVLPPAAPLAIATSTVVGMALAMQLKNEKRITVSFIGEGGTSLGEWHEAINWAATRRLPVIFCVENNQIALSTSVSEQSAAKQFADKGAGYGLESRSLDGTDPDAIFEAFDWGIKKAPVLIELNCMRFCGHAHHDDMLYWGKEPEMSLEYPKMKPTGYMNLQAWEFWRHHDPIQKYAQKLIQENLYSFQEIEQLKSEAVQICEEAVQEIRSRPWPQA